MRGDVTVYSPKNIICSMGTHIPSGFAEDSFITITPQGDDWQCVGQFVEVK